MSGFDDVDSTHESVQSSASDRFQLANVGDSEDLELYKKGGHHPTHLGDTFGDRYRIVHKLGSGGFSTVWLAYDSFSAGWRALKIVVADKSLEVAKNAIICQKAVSDMEEETSHTQQRCFQLKNLDHLDDEGIYRLLGEPKTGPLETFSGEIPGPEAPKYIVGALDFLSSEEDVLLDDVCLIDLDQIFSQSSPPDKMTGIQTGYLAPEVAVGQPSGPASDIWALGCIFLHLRSGLIPFAGYDIVESPASLITVLKQYFGNLPESWGEPLFDEDGEPTTDPTKGESLRKPEEEQSLRKWISEIWDQPPDLDAFKPSTSSEPTTVWFDGENIPYPACYEDKFWKPSAIRVGDVHLGGYEDEVEAVIEKLPKIPNQEVQLLHDLLSKIFVYDPAQRIGIGEILAHPWFWMNEEKTGKRKREESDE